jgi:hypothetical protein
VVPSVCKTRDDASHVLAVPRGSCLARTRCRATAMEGWGRVRELQVNRLFCKPICKPATARQRETGETEPTE